ncbi:hypothetical protein MMAG44476_39462 [Mycolicibacterium mageritense DSM 44476 = CIP 104973]|uniref:Uncharacterized protein n=2 Tax=Mycolicibacterium mageritense TaxID=53462 RepID=A0ABM7I159_MYCME|nr:hypothetical protein MMAGJ_58830 [Mycolicibacterium mageritense]CDO26234.1 hypothetical protein BN978_06789 [Mycolicibacterium mageritense DSM 44476 = CIP 104973]
MLRELRAIDLATMPKYKWDKRVHVLAALCLVGSYVCLGLSYIFDTPILSYMIGILMLIGGGVIFVAIVLLNLHDEPIRTHKWYQRKIDELESEFADNAK